MCWPHLGNKHNIFGCHVSSKARNGAPLVQTEPILEGFDDSSCGNEDVPKADEEDVFVPFINQLI